VTIFYAPLKGCVKVASLPGPCLISA